MHVHSVVMRARGPAGILAETTYLDLLKLHLFADLCLSSFFRKFREFCQFKQILPIQAKTPIGKSSAQPRGVCIAHSRLFACVLAQCLDSALRTPTV